MTHRLAASAAPDGSADRSPPPARSYRPYCTTPIFDEASLPPELCRPHRTADGVWAVIRVIEGRLTLHSRTSQDLRHLARQQFAIVCPGEEHSIEVAGPVRLRIEFHDAPPFLAVD